MLILELPANSADLPRITISGPTFLKEWTWSTAAQLKEPLSMCSHVYTANYHHRPAGMGQKCPYPEFYQKVGGKSDQQDLTLPVDHLGLCVFHSRQVDWKRSLDMQGRFRRLVELLNADATLKYFDFAEFVFVGSPVPTAPKCLEVKVSNITFRQQAYFFAATFLDPVVFETIEFRNGANFDRATFEADLKMERVLVNSLAFNETQVKKRAWFEKVEFVSVALFEKARFRGTSTGYVVKFDYCIFDAITDFTNADFLLGEQSAVGFIRTRFEESVVFSQGRFRCQLIFDEVSFAGDTEFIDTLFENVGSSARFRGSALELNQVEVLDRAVLKFESTRPQQKMFDHDVQFSFKSEPTGLIRFQNVNFKNIVASSRELLTQLARLGRVEIGSGCIKYRFQTANMKIDVSEGNSPLVLKICQTFSNYFTVTCGLNLGLEVVDRTPRSVHFFFFTDENITEEEFLERLGATAERMWSLLGTRTDQQLLALAEPPAAVQVVDSKDEENFLINAVDCIGSLSSLFWSVGMRLALGRWTAADTRALLKATPLRQQDPELAQRLHVVLIDRYTGARLHQFNQQQHGGLILAFRDEPPIEPIDFAILTAIEVERRAVCRAFNLNSDCRRAIGSRVYWRGKMLLGNGQSYELVVAQSPDAANIDAALLTNDLIHDWKPGAILLVGIAGSTEPAKVKLGDVVLGSDVFYYERGKSTPQGNRPEPKLISADATLWANVRSLPDWDGNVPVPRPDGTDLRPQVHAGVIASGEKVIADAEARDEIGSAHRKIIAIEMEGYGFSRAVWQAFEQVRHLDIRAISDDGSIAKDDLWHEYAAAVAAGFARHFLLDRPLSPRRSAARIPTAHRGGGDPDM